MSVLMTIAAVYFLWRIILHYARGEYAEAYLCVLIVMLLAYTNRSAP